MVISGNKSVELETKRWVHSYCGFLNNLMFDLDQFLSLYESLCFQICKTKGVGLNDLVLFRVLQRKRINRMGREREKERN